MERRKFISSAVTAGASLCALPRLQLQPGTLPSRLIPADKGLSTETVALLQARGKRRSYRGPNAYAIGMPIGGICAGQLYLLGDGTLGGWRVDGRLNPTGYGSESYRTRRAQRELVQDVTLKIAQADGTERAITLAGPQSGGDCDDTEFIGEYPMATVRYHFSERAPVAVTLRAYSPFCPLNARESAIPCTVLRYTLSNRSDSRAVGTLQARLQNGVELAGPGEVAAAQRNRTVLEPGFAAVVMDAIPSTIRGNPRPARILADFEGDGFTGWTAEGEAFKAGPSRGARPHQNPVSGFEGQSLLNSFSPAENTAAGDRPTGTLTSDEFLIDRDFITFLIGGGAHAGRTCLNLLIDGKPARTATGHDDEKLAPAAWNVRDLAGKRARLQVVDAASGPWGHVNVDAIRLTDELPESLMRPRPDSETNGTMCIAYFGTGTASPSQADVQSHADSAQAEGTPLIATVTASFTLDPGQSTEITFCVSWHFPTLHTGQGQMYSNWFKDAADAARFVAANDRRLLEQTELFRKTFYDDTTLPWWFALRVMMPTSYLATGTSQWWKNGRFWGWEGVGCCHGTCTHVWNYSHAEARLFPELARSTRIMQDLGSGFDERTGRVAFRGEVDKGFEYAADGQAGTVLKMYREHLGSPDGSFLRDNWRRIKKVLEFLIAKDAELDPSGRSDGIIEGVQHNTFDINFIGANTFVGSLYLAALLAGEEMAKRVGDGDAGRYRALYRSGRDISESRLYNGEYFIQKIPPDKPTQWQYGDGCLGDQLFGQNWARCLGLDTIYDEVKVRSALSAVHRYNWAPPGGALRQYNAVFPPEREFARDREGALLVCTWPRGSRPGEPVRYRDEVWTGCEYQAAAGMMWEGLLPEALSIVKAVDDRYDGALHNPWNEVECGDHYSRAMAAWAVFQAACGFGYNGPAGVISLDPRLSADDFAAFFPAAEGWGLISQSRNPNALKISVQVRWGLVRLTELQGRLPVEAADPRLEVSLDNVPMKATIQPRGRMVGAILNGPAFVRAGQTVQFRWTW